MKLLRINRDTIRKAAAVSRRETAYWQERLLMCQEMAKLNRAVLFQVDRKGHLSQVNDVVREVLGYAPEEIDGGMHFFNLHPEEGRREFIQQVMAFVDARQPFSNLEHPMLTKDGHLIQVSTSGKPVFTDKGEFSGYYGVSRDITETWQAHQSLKMSEQRFKNLLQQVEVVAVQGYDMNGTVHYWNKASEERYGYTEKEAMGRNLLDLIIPETLKPEVKNAIDRMNRKHKPMPPGELTLRKKDGSPAHVYSCHTLTQTAQGEPELFCMDIDISHRIQMEEQLKASEEKLRSLLESMDDLVFVLDKDLVYRECHYKNPVDLAASPDEFIGKKFENTIVQEPAHSRIRDAMEQTLATEIPQRVQYWLDMPRGRQWFDMNVSILRIKSGKIEGITTVVRNITQLKKTEEALLETNRQLLRAKETAEKANAVKTQFLGNMSHELRTPLNGLMGMTQLMQMTPLTEEQQEYMNISFKSCQSLAAVVTDILNYTSLDQQPQSVHMTDFQLGSLIHEVTELHRVAAAMKGITLMADVDARVPAQLTGDRYKIRQVMNNLLGNAVKFTERGSVQLSVDWHETGSNDGGGLVFAVKDTGIGIEPDQLEYVFQQFAQADESHTRSRGGIGLGLATARELARLIGGEITVESRVNQGSCFTFYCPCQVKAEDELSKGKQISVREGEEESIRILVVDDDESGRQLARLQIEKLAYRADVAVSGLEAAALFRKHAYHLVLMDIQMPLMDGYETARAMRTHEKEQESNPVPILALTAQTHSGIYEACRSAGIDDVLMKPVDGKLLKETLIRFLPQ